MSYGQPYASGGAELPPGGIEPPKRSTRPLGVALVAVLVIAIVGLTGFAILQNVLPYASPGPAGSFAAAASPSADSSADVPSVSPGKSPKLSRTPKPGDTPGPTGTPAPAGDVAMPIVPVVGFWSTATDISSADLKSASWARTRRTRRSASPLPIAMRSARPSA